MSESDLLDRGQSDCAPVMDAFAVARRHLAARWLELSPDQVKKQWGEELGRLHRLVSDSGVRDRTRTAADESILARIAKALEGPQAPSPGALLAAMLFYYQYELPTLCPLEALPDWFIQHYLQYMQTPPSLFREPGDAEQFVEILTGWIGYLQQRISASPADRSWQQIGEITAQMTKFTMAYFTADNLRNLMSLRARIIEQILVSHGHLLDYSFGPRPPRRKVRLGILATHFGPQAETFATLPIYRHIDRDRFETVLVATKQTNLPFESLCKSAADQFILLPQDLAAQVNAIRRADLDILFLGTNVTAVSNGITILATHRLARMQVAGVCSCVTTAMRNVDYYLSGSMSEPAQGAQDHYTERLLLIDGPAHCYDLEAEKRPETVPALSREEVGLSDDDVVFASGANFYKILPELDEVWARILAATPGSRLLLYPFNPNWSSGYPQQQPFLDRLKAAFARHGIAADRLLIFHRAPGREQVLQRLKLADIYLDSYPFGGATSLLDPLCLGIPSIAMEGTNFRSLVGAAFLRELHLDDFITKDEQSYIDLAVKLATDRAMRESSRRRVIDAMAASPRFLDVRQYGRQVGDILLEAWDSHFTGA